MVVDVTSLMEAANTITDRKTEFKKVISFLKQVFKEAKKKYGSDIDALIQDESYYKEVNTFGADTGYEDFLDGYSNEVYILSMDCFTDDKDYNDRADKAFNFIVKEMQYRVSKCQQLTGTIDGDGYKHDYFIIYTSKIKV